MIYKTAQDWNDADAKRVLFYGMSGLGKTYISQMLRDSGGWFHYSIDYRIGTRYLGERIVDNAKAHAMKVPFLRDLLMSDSIYIGSNITFNNLAPVSTWLGKPGNPDKGGMPIAEYRKRQALFRHAEISALLDTGYFIERSEELYGYRNFVCDTGGSICEWVEGDDPEDALLQELASHCLLVWIKGNEAHTQELIRRFDKAPKPMAYKPEFLDTAWQEYTSENNLKDDEVDPDAFIRWTYARALAHRAPRYAAMEKWGVSVTADEIAAVTSEAEFDRLIAIALARRSAQPI